MSCKIRVVALAAGFALLAGAGSGTVVRAQMDHSGHGPSGQAMSHEGHGSQPVKATPQGLVIRESKLQGYALVYRLYSWDERNVMMKGMEGHDMPGMDRTGKSSHHLMVFITGADGKALSGGKVGFIVSGPDKSEFKTLTMGMSDGYGADVPLKAKGDYSIKVKAVLGEKTLSEEFTYTAR